MRVGYARVSTADQNLERQLEVLRDKYHVDKIYDEKLSGKNTDRPAFQNMMQELKEGDTLVVSELSRLGRSLKDLLLIVEELNNRNVNIIFDKENIDTTTATGRMMFGLLATLAQFEREQMLERQREGIKIAKEQGRYKGRRPVQRDQENINQICQLYFNRQLNLKQSCSMIKNCNVRDKSGALIDTYGVTVPTFYKIFEQWCNENKIKKVGYMQVVDGEDTSNEE
jgi:DNA invertase Pin-like site-specific DNA recombinase